MDLSINKKVLNMESMRGVLLICHIRENPWFWQAAHVSPAASAESCQEDLSES